jgi:hypothetical protein
MKATQALARIQQVLNAPKDQYNIFGKYSYRTCEGILKAVKPLIKAEKCTILLSDEVKQVGDWCYIIATVTLIHIESGESVTVNANAREALAQKGMSDAQISGTSSSYARKYALNGMFLIDDSRDADSIITTLISDEQITELEELIKTTKTDKPKFLQYMKVSELGGIELSKFNVAVSALNAKKKTQ